MGFGPVLPGLGHFGDEFGVLVHEVVLFGAIGGEVVEFPLVGAGFADQLPVAFSGHPVVVMFPEHPFGLGLVLGLECWGKAASVEGGDGVLLVGGGVGSPGEFKEGGDDIRQVAACWGDGSGLGFESGWPMDDQRGRDAAFVESGLVSAEGRIGGIGPGGSVGDCAPDIRVVDVFEFTSAEVVVGFSAGAVVGEEDRDRVVQEVL
ncbi:MAG: hypothetical protein RI897_644 [Verrucomicrobiota bacterium]